MKSILFDGRNDILNNSFLENKCQRQTTEKHPNKPKSKPPSKPPTGNNTTEQTGATITGTGRMRSLLPDFFTKLHVKPARTG